MARELSASSTTSRPPWFMDQQRRRHERPGTDPAPAAERPQIEVRERGMVPRPVAVRHLPGMLAVFRSIAVTRE